MNTNRTKSNRLQILPPQQGPSSLTYVEVFQSLNQAYSRIIDRAGYKIAASRAGSTERFASLPSLRQQEICSNLTRSLSIYESAVKENIQLRPDYEQSLVWYTLRYLKLRPPSRLFQHLTSEDIIEIYDSQHVQIFRSFNMFECLSYTLEELHSYEWWELYERDQVHTDQFLGYLQDLVAGKIIDPVLINGAPHYVSERFSPKQKKALISTKVFSPLFTDNNQVGGYLSTTQLYKIES